MIGVIATLKAQPGKGPELETAFGKLAEQVRDAGLAAPSAVAGTVATRMQGHYVDTQNSSFCSSDGRRDE